MLRKTIFFEALAQHRDSVHCGFKRGETGVSHLFMTHRVFINPLWVIKRFQLAAISIRQ